MMAAYYNEFNPQLVAWLRLLIKCKAIADGDIDSRSICDVQADDLKGYTQCHFFAGIGGWSLACRLADWPDDRHIWTGSCPCQPFSTAGKGLGTADERHLWPAFRNLISQRQPQHVLGEQVANAVRHGWLDGVQTDLEAEGYACGAAILGAHSLGSPHQRKRLYWAARRHTLADTQRGGRRQGRVSPELATVCEPRQDHTVQTEERSASVTLADTTGGRCQQRETLGKAPGNPGESDKPIRVWDTYRVIDCQGIRKRIPAESWFRGLADGFPGIVDALRDAGVTDREIQEAGESYPIAGDIPGSHLLLHGYGNAIVPQVAAQFIRAYASIIGAAQ